MTEIFGIPTQALFGQLLIGLINGSFYALLSLGLAVIFGLLNIINFTHGAQYMMGAFCAYFLMTKLGIGYWWALAIAPLAVGIIGMVIERLMLARLYKLDHLYGLLLTFGLALIIQGLFRNEYGTSGIPYAMPPELSGGRNLGFMFLPNYRAWVIRASIVVCLATWFVIEKTRLGAYLRAATENPELVQAFGINVPRMITLTYGFGVALAAFAGVMAAPIYQVNPLMGADLIIVVFAVVVIGGMGSILGAIITGFGLGVVEGLTKVFYPEASNTVIFVVMVIVLILRPAGRVGGARRGGRGAGDPPPGYLFRDDHSGDRADGVLFLPADAVHAWRGWHPGGAARKTLRRHRPCRHAHDVLRRPRHLRRRVSSYLPHRAFALRPGVEGDSRERAAGDLAGLQRRSL